MIFEDEREVVVLVLTPAERILIERALKELAAHRSALNGDRRLTQNVIEMLESSRWSPHDLKWLLATIAEES